MDKKILISLAFAAVVVVSGGVSYALVHKSNDQKATAQKTTNDVMMKLDAQTAAMKKEETTAKMEKDSEDAAMKKEATTDAMQKETSTTGDAMERVTN